MTTEMLLTRALAVAANNDTVHGNHTTAPPKTHSAVLGTSEQIVLYIGLMVFFTLSVVGFAAFLVLRRRLKDISMIEFIHGKVWFVCAVYGVVFLYMSAGDFVYYRHDDHLPVYAPLLVAAFFMWTDFTYSAATFMQLDPWQRTLTTFSAVFGGLITLSSCFASVQARYPAFFVGGVFYTPVAWWLIKYQLRTTRLRKDRYAIAMLVLLFVFKCFYVWLTMMGHAFGDVFGRTDEFALYIVMFFVSVILSIALAARTRAPTLPVIIQASEYSRSKPLSSSSSRTLNNGSA